MGMMTDQSVKRWVGGKFLSGVHSSHREESNAGSTRPEVV